MSTMTTILQDVGSLLSGGTSAISSEVTTAEQYGFVAYVIIAFELAVIAFLLAGISKKLSR